MMPLTQVAVRLVGYSAVALVFLTVFAAFVRGHHGDGVIAGIVAFFQDSMGQWFLMLPMAAALLLALLIDMVAYARAIRHRGWFYLLKGAVVLLAFGITYDLWKFFYYGYQSLWELQADIQVIGMVTLLCAAPAGWVLYLVDQYVFARIFRQSSAARGGA